MKWEYPIHYLIINDSLIEGIMRYVSHNRPLIKREASCNKVVVNEPVAGFN